MPFLPIYIFLSFSLFIRKMELIVSNTSLTRFVQGLNEINVYIVFHAVVAISCCYQIVIAPLLPGRMLNCYNYFLLFPPMKSMFWKILYIKLHILVNNFFVIIKRFKAASGSFWSTIASILTWFNCNKSKETWYLERLFWVNILPSGCLKFLKHLADL